MSASKAHQAAVREQGLMMAHSSLEVFTVEPKVPTSHMAEGHHSASLRFNESIRVLILKNHQNAVTFNKYHID